MKLNIRYKYETNEQYKENIKTWTCITYFFFIRNNMQTIVMSNISILINHKLGVLHIVANHTHKSVIWSARNLTWWSLSARVIHVPFLPTRWHYLKHDIVEMAKSYCMIAWIYTPSDDKDSVGRSICIYCQCIRG